MSSIPTSQSSLTQWLDWLQSNSPISAIDLGLERIKQVGAALDLLNPTTPIITVAGTNGKGSVIATLESLAETHGLNVGSYTSPHLLHFNERIKIDGVSVNDTLICESFSVIAQAQGSTYLSYFEFTTLVALHIFSNSQLDFIALEVGLGGRLDAVNCIDADVAVITSIGLDHTAWLGNDLKTIGREKAGIMRTEQPVIIADSALLPLLEDTINDIEPIVLSENNAYMVEQKDDFWSLSLNEVTYELPYNDLYISNIAAAIVAFDQVFSQKVSYPCLYKAIETLSFTGRFQKISDSPYIIVDVAHNPDSAYLLNQKLESLKQQHPELIITALCGMLKDKDIKSTLNQVSVVDQWITCDLPGDRGAEGHELLEHLHKQRQICKNEPSLVDAVEDYWHYATDKHLLVVFGSFVTVGLMLTWWQDKGLTWTKN